MNNHIQDAQGPMKFKYDYKRKKVIITLILDKIPKGLIEMEQPDDKCHIFMNDHLNKILGISDKSEKIKFS